MNTKYSNLKLFEALKWVDLGDFGLEKGLISLQIFNRWAGHLGMGGGKITLETIFVLTIGKPLVRLSISLDLHGNKSIVHPIY